MSKDTFKSSISRHTGGDTNEKAQLLKSELQMAKEEILFKNHTVRISEPTLEKIKDYVYHMRMNGFPFYSQSQLLEEAFTQFLETKAFRIASRPPEIKEKEKKRTGRKIKGKRSSGNFGDLLTY